jgi:ABC-type multidrug transport system ATPase subunit/ABC-type multidrug transport system permease subunit
VRDTNVSFTGPITRCIMTLFDNKDDMRILTESSTTINEPVNSHPEKRTSNAAPEWHLAGEVRRLEQLDADSDEQPRKLGVSWTDVNVKGINSGATFNENVLSQFNPFHKSVKGDLKTIIDGSHGCVKPGEMLLVLGRPGAGCTTLLNILANNRLGYEEITGDVRFGTMTSKDAQAYRGQIVMNTEEEVFFPTLSVQNTIDFAARMKSPRRFHTGITTQEQYAQEYKEFLLESVGISHTAKTKVGDAFTRGVSGGERKRVSILECLTTRASVYCWDNSTRGLDASTALEYIKAIRAMTDILGLSTIVTLYQAGNGIYEQFDKVLVLDEGKQLYYGPRKDAVPFMESLGFVCVDGSNKGDFLTGVTVPTERKIALGYENRFPRTSVDIAAVYARSQNKTNMIEESQRYSESEAARVDTLAFQDLVAKERHRGVRNSPVSANFFKQVQIAVIRQYQLLWGDKSTMFVKQAATLAQALIGGSLFYAAPNDNLGLFIKGGAIFFSTLYHALLALGEVTDSFTGRPVLAKHRSFALYHPAAFVVAQVVADIPLLMFQVGHFSIVLYWMVGLRHSASAFFTFLLISYFNALTMTQYFRAVGAAFPTFDAATKVSGLTFVSLFMYMGYMIARPAMHPWLYWIYYINPMAYTFDALMSNEFHNTEMPCVGPNLIPNGPGYGTGAGGQSCVGVIGAAPGDTRFSGDSYLAGLSYSSSHVWRNFGILCAWWMFFIAVTVFFTSRWKQVGEGGRKLLIPREKQNKANHLLHPRDEEAHVSEKKLESSSESNENVKMDLLHNKSIFTWKNLTYTVKTPDGDRVLLDNVQGYVKPGMLGALMGSSGAGKTTLLDVLAQRKTQGTINGSVFVDGRSIPVSFQGSAGYVEQLDVHEPLATVREALEFSALLRQSRDTPDEDKLRYVDTIIDLLELNALEHTLIGVPGSGLSIEQRKRLTIAVELVAKPSILIFLDEPTSGLDGQAAFNTVRFLRKLAAAGQAILVTIHQPSAQLFAQFDKLLLLTKGGKTVYFGDIGDNANTIKGYLSRNGASCPPEANPAEHMIEVVTGAGGKDKDWNQIWLESDEHKQVSNEIDAMVSHAASYPTTVNDDGNEFAASIWTQTKLVTKRMNVSLYRNTEYVMNKVAMHVLLALLNGFTFWMIGDSLNDLQQNLFTVFNVIFVSPGVISQLQPLFIDRRDIYEAREKKSKIVCICLPCGRITH